MLAANSGPTLSILVVFSILSGLLVSLLLHYRPVRLETIFVGYILVRCVTSEDMERWFLSQDYATGVGG
jgi:hypothetical protein